MINTIIHGNSLDELKKIPDKSVNSCVTSPPYWRLRDYDVDGQIGMEKTLEEYLIKITAVFREVFRVLKPDGTLFVNIGDLYAKKGCCGQNGKNHYVTHTGKIKHYVPKGIKPKSLVGLPWRVAFALQDDGWCLRNDIIWHKPNPLPESVKDRFTKAHEYIFFFTKSKRYYFDYEAVWEDVSYTTQLRLQQDIENQQGSLRVPGKTNGPMKACCYKGSRKEFRGGGKYTTNQCLDNSQPVANTSKGNNTFSRRNEKDEESSFTHRKKFDSTQGGSGFKGHSGYYDKNGNPLCGLKRNKRDVWTVATQSFTEGHYATYPEKLIEPCILAGCPPEGIVLDPFMGSGTTAVVAIKTGRKYLGIELKEEYKNIAEIRIGNTQPILTGILS